MPETEANENGDMRKKRSSCSKDYSKHLYLKRHKMENASCSCSDSGVSVISNSSCAGKADANENMWPSLKLISKPDELVLNGKNKKRFPDPVHDRSILLACFDRGKNMLKLRQQQENLDIKNALFVQRLQHDIWLEEECKYFIRLDSVEFDDLGNDEYDESSSTLLMISDVREHAVASHCLPDTVTGYWIRILGPMSKHVLYISLWKKVDDDFTKERKKIKCNEKQKKDDVMKIGEITVELLNDGVYHPRKMKIKKNKNYAPPSKNILSKDDTEGCDFTPLFCCKEQFTQITTILNECRENGNHELFNEMYEKFSKNLKDQTSKEIELKLLLYSEKSLYHAIRGEFIEAKKLLQDCVDQVISKSANKVFLLNRAYLSLAVTHAIEGNYGNAEECLNILQKDKKNGVPYEDLIMFYMLYAIVTINFAKTLAPTMAKLLLDESYSWLQKALLVFEKNDVILTYVHKYYHLRLLFVEYYIIRQRTGYNHEVDIETILKDTGTHLDIVEKHLHLLSKRLKSLFLVTKGQMTALECGKVSEGCSMIKEGRNIAKEMQFYRENILAEKLLETFSSEKDQDRTNGSKSPLLTS